MVVVINLFENTILDFGVENLEKKTPVISAAKMIPIIAWKLTNKFD
jgi:hypothetical protein